MEDGQHPDQGKNKNKVIGEKLVQDKIIDTSPEHTDLSKEWKSTRDHPIQNFIKDISKGVTTQ